MSDEARDREEIQRPVEPPLIDLEAEDVTPEEQRPPSGDEITVEEEGTPPPREPAAAVPESRSPRSHALSAGIAALAAVAVIVLAIVAGFIPTTTVDLAPLEAKVASIESTANQTGLQAGQLAAAIDELRASTKAVSNDIANLKESIEALKAQDTGGVTRDDLEAAIGASEEKQTALAGEIEGLKQEIAKLQPTAEAEQSPPAAPPPQKSAEAPAAAAPATEPAGKSGGASKLATAFMAIDAAASEGRPFQIEIEELSRLNPPADEAVAVAPFAAKGVPTRQDLHDRLKGIIEETSAPLEATSGNEGGGLWSTVKKKVASVVRIRKLDDATFLDAASDALRIMDQGDFPGGVKRLRATPGTPPPAMEAWLKDAEARVALDGALESLSTAIVQKISRGQ